MTSPAGNNDTPRADLNALRWMVVLILLTQAAAVFLHLGTVVVAWMEWGPVSSGIALVLPVVAELFVFSSVVGSGYEPYVWACVGWAVIAVITFTVHYRIVRR